MNIVVALLGGAAIVTLTVSGSRLFKIKLSLAMWIGGVLLLALTPPPHQGTLLSRIATVSTTSALGIMIGELIGNIVHRRFSISLRGTIAMLTGAVGLGLLVILHNVMSASKFADDRFSDIDLANPWGLVVIMTIIAFSCTTARIWQDEERLDGFDIIIPASAVALAALQIAIKLGMVEGNNLKNLEGLGGVGLGTLSTNETSTLALALMLWCLRLLHREPRRRPWAAWLGVVCAIVAVFLTESRMGSVLAVIAFGANVAVMRTRPLFKWFAFVPVALVVVLVGYQIVTTRTVAEGLGAVVSNDPLENMPGSGRPVLWNSFLEAFTDSAANSVSTLGFGVGSVGLLELYDSTTLKQRGFVLPTASFYPTHSDVLTILVTCGLVGLMLWIVTMIGLLRLPIQSQLKPLAYCAAAIFIVESLGDMLVNVPLVTALLMTLIVSCVISGDVDRVVARRFRTQLVGRISSSRPPMQTAETRANV